MDRATGAIPSVADYRDGLAGASISAIEAGAISLPAQFKTDIEHLAVLDQNKVPACVGHAWAILMKHYWWKQTGKLVDFSPRFLDILSNQPWLGPEDGRYPRDVAKISAKFGCCTTAMLPNDTEGLTIVQYRDKNVITPAMMEEAAQYKIPGYVRVGDNTILDFRTAVMQFGLVSGLFAISDAFWSPSWNSNDIDPLRTKAPTSNHQMVVYGWDGILNTLRNSWSQFWNRQGNGTYDAKTWLPYVWEGWSIAEIPTDAQALLSALPKPQDFAYQWNRNLSVGNVVPDEDVKFAQIALMILGLMKPVPPDQLGYYGPRTSQAVLAYQNIKKISPTAPNSIGPKTRAALNKDFPL